MNVDVSGVAAERRRTLLDPYPVPRPVEDGAGE
jgi:hypothetical protein